MLADVRISDEGVSVGRSGCIGRKRCVLVGVGGCLGIIGWVWGS